MRKRHQNKPPPFKAGKNGAPSGGISKRKKVDPQKFRIHAMGKIWTPAPEVKERILNDILKIPYKTPENKENTWDKNKKNPNKEPIKEPGHLLKQGIKFSSKAEFTSYLESAKKNKNVDKKSKLKDVSSPPPHTGAINPAFNDSMQDTPNGKKNVSSSKSMKNEDISTTDSVHHRLKKDKIKELLASTPVNEPIEPMEIIEPPVDEPEPEPVEPPRPLTKKEKKERREARKKTIFDLAKERLSTARFRYLNELMYTQTSAQTVKMFKQDNTLFDAYLEGYKKAAGCWKKDPLDTIIAYVNKTPRTTIVADMGCGDARLARSVRRTVHSFDIASTAPGVVQCDMSNVPLPNESVDLVVFCLALMGTNIKDFLLEASRILKEDGIIKIAELESRIPKNDMDFIRNMGKFGFKLKWKNTKERFFVFYDFIKEREPNSRNNLPQIELKPCLYKKR